MKKIILSIIMLSAGMVAMAQHAPGTVTLQPKVGLNISSMTDADDADPRFGVAAGAELEYQVNSFFSISGGALYSMQGLKGSDDVDITMKLDYINVPIMANFYVVKGLALKAGIQPGFNVNSKLSASENKVSGSVDMGDITKTVDFSIPMGISYEYKNFVVEGRYNLGVTKVFKDKELNIGGESIDLSGTDSKNSVFQFTLGYKFEL